MAPTSHPSRDRMRECVRGKNPVGWWLAVPLAPPCPTLSPAPHSYQFLASVASPDVAQGRLMTSCSFLVKGAHWLTGVLTPAPGHSVLRFWSSLGGWRLRSRKWLPWPGAPPAPGGAQQEPSQALARIQATSSPGVVRKRGWVRLAQPRGAASLL